MVPSLDHFENALPQVKVSRDGHYYWDALSMGI
jgi:hypothetical protein